MKHRRSGCVRQHTLTRSPDSFQIVRSDMTLRCHELNCYRGRILQRQLKKNLYQRKIVSLPFVAVNNCPDIAFATSRLARFLTNSSAEHQRAADRVPLYLHFTRTLELQVSGSDDLVVASDVSFADGTVDRESSEGFILKLFGGAIAGRAN